MSQSISQIKEPGNQENRLKLDAYQTDSEIIIKSAIAGVDPRDVEIDIANDILTIKGMRSGSEEIKAEAYYYRECHWGSFSRSIILPSDIDTANIKATLKNGILTVRIPKSGKVQTQKIKIQSE